MLQIVRKGDHLCVPCESGWDVDGAWRGRAGRMHEPEPITLLPHLRLQALTGIPLLFAPHFDPSKQLKDV
jgi:hypothetical protein